MISLLPKLTPQQQREAIKRRDCGGESLADIGRPSRSPIVTPRLSF
jgi:hypothetical protein